MKNVTGFYESYDEDSRLTTNQARRIEFITTTTFIDRYLHNNERILEVGAGTGIYSFYYAEKDYQVTATDITPKHVEIIKSKLNRKRNISMDTQVADATNLSNFEDEYFDAVLCLGPMYHLISIENQKKCISESLRVLKPGGLLAIAYITRFSVFPYLVKTDRKYLTEDWMNRIIDKGYITSDEEDCFWTDAYFHTPNELVKLMNSFDIEMVEHIATDGIGPLMSHLVNDLNNEEFEVWVKYHLKVCTEPSVLGNSNHALYLCKKKK